MRLFLFFALLLLGTRAANAQTTDSVIFNRSFIFDYRLMVFSGLEVTDSCIWIAGIMYDTNPVNPNYLLGGSFLAKADHNGHILWRKPLMEHNHRYTIWDPTLQTAPDGNLVACGYDTDETAGFVVVQHFVVKFDPATGDTIWLRRYVNPDYFFFRDMAVLPNGDFVLITNCQNPVQDDVAAVKMDSAGNFVSHHLYGLPTTTDIAGKLAATPDGNVMLSFYSKQGTSGGFMPGNNNRQRFFKIDAQTLQPIWEYVNPNWLYSSQSGQGVVVATHHILVTRDSSYVFSGAQTDNFQQNQTNAFVFKYKEVPRAPVQGLKWYKKLKTGIQAYLINMDKAVELPDGNIAVAGTGFHTQAVYPTEALTIWVNILDGETGDSLWSKHYYAVGGESPTGEPWQIPMTQNFVYDMELDSAGNVVLCGEGRLWYRQHGWLLKIALPTEFPIDTTVVIDTTIVTPGDSTLWLDDLPALAADSLGWGTAVVQQADMPLLFRLYPNPARDYTVLDLTLHPGAEPERYALSVFDAAGRSLLDMPLLVHNSGFVVIHPNLAPGSYWFVLRRDGRTLAAKTLVRE